MTFSLKSWNILKFIKKRLITVINVKKCLKTLGLNVFKRYFTLKNVF